MIIHNYIIFLGHLWDVFIPTLCIVEFIIWFGVQYDFRHHKWHYFYAFQICKLITHTEVTGYSSGILRSLEMLASF